LKSSMNGDTETQLALLKNLLAQKDETLRQYELSMTHLSSQLSEFELKERDLLHQRLLLESDLDSVRSELETLRSSLAEELEERWQTLSGEADSLREAIALKDTAIHQLEQIQLPSLRSELAEADSSLRNQQQRLEASESQFALVKEEITLLRDAVVRFETDVPHMEADFESKLSKLTSSNNDLVIKLSGLEDLLMQRDAEIASLKQKLVSAQFDLENVIAKEVEIRRANEDALSNAEMKQQQLESLRQTLQTLNESVIPSLQAKIEEKDAKLALIRDEFDAKQRLMEHDLDSTRARLSAKSEELESVLKEAKVLSDHLSRANQVLNSSDLDQSRQLTEMAADRRVESLNQDLHASNTGKESLIESLMREKEDLARELDHQTTQLAQLRSECLQLKSALDGAKSAGSAESSRLASQIELLSEESEILRNDIKRLQADKEDYSRQAEATSLQHSNSVQNLEVALAKQIEEQESQKTKLEGEVAEQQGQISSLTNLLEAAHKANETERLQAESELQNLHQASNYRISELQGRLSQLEHQLSQFSESNPEELTLKERLAASTREAENLASEMQKLQAELLAVNETRAAEAIASHNVQVEVRTLRAEIDRVDHLRAEQAEELGNLESKLRVSFREQNHLRDELSSTTAELNDVAKTRDLLVQQLQSETTKQEEVETLRKESACFQLRIRELEQTLANNARQLDEAALGELNSLRRQLESERKLRDVSLRTRTSRLWKLLSLLLVVILCAVSAISSVIFSAEIEDSARHQLGLYLAGFM
jgi:chromosome segregation ATPase